MHRFTTVLFAVGFLYAQGYQIKYDFTFSVNSGITPTEEPITIASGQAIIGLGIQGATISKTVAPALQGGLWSASFEFSIPDTYSQTKATSQFTSSDFSADLQTKLRDQKLTNLKITSATYTGPDGTAVPAAAPSTGAVACGKDPLVAGLFAIFLATFGVARFYYGYILAGVFKLILGLFAHCGNAIGGNVAKKSDGDNKAKSFVLVTFLAEIGFFVWWIYDMVVIWNHSLKPFGKPQNCFFTK